MTDGLAPAPTLGVVTTDRELIVRGWNDWVASATGVPETGVVGKPLLDFVPGERHDFYRDLFAEVIERGTPRVLAPAFHKYLIECAPRLPSEHFAHMQQRVTVAPLHAQTSVVGVMITLEDVTERLDSERASAASLGATPNAIDTSRATAILGSEDWRSRRAAVQALAQSASVDEIRHLFDALQRDHHDLNVLNSALRVLIATGRSVVSPLVELLSDREPNLRMHAALALGELGARDAVPGLLRSLDDEDENVRFHAIEALGRLGDPESIDRLAAIAASGDFFVSFAAIEALAKFDDPRIARLMVDLLDQEALRPAVIATLASIGDEDSAAPLARVLHEGAHTGPAAAALVQIHRRYQQTLGTGSFVVDAVREAVDARTLDRLAAVSLKPGADRIAVVTVLSWIGSSAITHLVGLIGELDLEEAVTQGVLGGGRESVPAVIDRLDDASPAVRGTAAALLGRLDDRTALPALLRTLEDADASVVASAAAAVSALGDAASIEPLMRLFAHASAAVRRAAIAGINSIGLPGNSPSLRDALANSDPRIRESALRVAGYFGFRETVPAVLSALADQVEDVRRAALEQLPMLEDVDAGARLAAALAAETPRNRAAAAHALRLCDDHDDEALIAALSDPDAWVRYYAATSLGARCVVAAEKPMADLARRDPATHVRIAAITALGVLNPSSAARVAGELLNEPDDDLAIAAITVLSTISGHGAIDRLDHAAHSPRPALQLAAVRALGSRPQVEAVELLSWAARIDTPGLAEEAIDGLRRIASTPGMPAAPPAAVNALLDLATEPAHHDNAIAAIAQFPDTLVPEVASGLSAVRVNLRVATARALAAMRSPRASSELARALRDEDGGVRATAITAFSKLGTPAVARAIAAMRDGDPDAGVRRCAALACDRHGWGQWPFSRS